MEPLTVKNINYKNLHTIIKQGGKCKGIVCNDKTLIQKSAKYLLNQKFNLI